MLLLMNASTPLLNLRWYLRNMLPRVHRKLIRSADVMFMMAFFLARVLLVPTVVGMYGRQHGMGVLETCSHALRLPCQLGTGAIWMGNLSWWTILVRGLVRDSRS